MIRRPSGNSMDNLINGPEIEIIESTDSEDGRRIEQSEPQGSTTHTALPEQSEPLQSEQERCISELKQVPCRSCGANDNLIMESYCGSLANAGKPQLLQLWKPPHFRTAEEARMGGRFLLHADYYRLCKKCGVIQFVVDPHVLQRFISALEGNGQAQTNFKGQTVKEIFTVDEKVVPAFSNMPHLFKSGI